MEKIYNQFLFKLAAQHNLAIVDLSRSFDYKDQSLYVSQIEPSEKGGQLISKLITHVVQKHDFKKGKLYMLKNKIIVEEDIDPNKKWSIDSSLWL